MVASGNNVQLCCLVLASDGCSGFIENLGLDLIEIRSGESKGGGIEEERGREVEEER